MTSLEEILRWISGNEALLSGIAALIAIGGLVVAPVGAALRRHSAPASDRAAPTTTSWVPTPTAQGCFSRPACRNCATTGASPGCARDSASWSTGRPAAIGQIAPTPCLMTSVRNARERATCPSSPSDSEMKKGYLAGRAFARWSNLRPSGSQGALNREHLRAGRGGMERTCQRSRVEDDQSWRSAGQCGRKPALLGEQSGRRRGRPGRAARLHATVHGMRSFTPPTSSREDIRRPQQ